MTAVDQATFLHQLKAFEGREVGGWEAGPDAVNEAMIRHWCEAVGDHNPIYTDPAAAEKSIHGGIVAPPTMLQAWVMRGLQPRPASGGSAQDDLMSLLDSHGFSSVVATNCEQEYARYVRPGDRLSERRVIESVSEEKRTALGSGHFVTSCSTYVDQNGDVVGTMRFRILKFKPAPSKPAEAPRPKRPRPAVTEDNAWWFEACNHHRLLIQRCTGCGTLRHPTEPACPVCHSFEWDTVEASGRGTVYSFVVNHYPQVPAFDYPLAVGLIELEEGTRLVANIVDIDPHQIEIGLPVDVVFVDHDEDLSLPAFRPRTVTSGMGGQAER
jgi:uncharacterized OB-fold protein/acyl dehydratase